MVTLTNVGTVYDSSGCPASKGLGFEEVDFTAATQLTFRVRCNKVGTGTISWQLWNETDGVEIGRIDDASAAGDNKSLVATITTGIPTGIKLVRVRCKSTVSGDDPVFYGASLLVLKP